jgi:GNAT superfamily N-acetyltransferase
VTPAIRAAGDADARATAALIVRSWRDAYRDLLPQEVLDALDVDDRERGLRKLIAADGTPVLVAADTEAGPVTGVAALSIPSRDQDATANTGEVVAIYVEPERTRQGIGAALLAEALTSLRRADCTEATLWVLAGNHPALAFYAGHGFAPDGATDTHPLSGRQTLRMRRAPL